MPPKISDKIRYNTCDIMNFIDSEIEDIRRINKALSMSNQIKIDSAKKKIADYISLEEKLFQDFKREMYLASAQKRVLLSEKCNVPFYKVSKRRRWVAENKRRIEEMSKKASITFSNWLKINHNISTPPKYVTVTVIPTMPIMNMSEECDVESYFLMAKGRLSCMEDGVISEDQLTHDQIFYWKYKRKDIDFCVWPKYEDEEEGGE